MIAYEFRFTIRTAEALISEVFSVLGGARDEERAARSAGRQLAVKLGSESDVTKIEVRRRNVRR